jgi:short-subunit dehydrogenase
MKHLKDKIVWITGASSGIGEALVYEFNKAGAKVILSSRRTEELERVQNSCINFETSTALVPLDLNDLESLEQKANQAKSIFGKIDILVNSGGISQRSKAVDTLLSIDYKLMTVNYFSAVALTKLLLPDMLANKSGHIVAISSLVGKFGTPYRSGYAASKHALHGFFDSLRAEVWQDGIEVTIATPGFIKTSISLNALTEKGEKSNVMDKGQANGMTASRCAKILLKSIQKGDEEVLIGGKETYAVYIKRFFPRWFSRIIRKVRVK